MTDPYQRQYGQQPPQPAWQPPQQAPRRPKRRGLMITLSVVLGILVLCVGVTVIYGVTKGDDPAAPADTTTTTEPTRPADDVGAGTPGAPCATNRLGKTFKGADGVTYTCGGPKPYHWLPPA